MSWKLGVCFDYSSHTIIWSFLVYHNIVFNPHGSRNQRPELKRMTFRTIEALSMKNVQCSIISVNPEISYLKDREEEFDFHSNAILLTIHGKCQCFLQSFYCISGCHRHYSNQSSSEDIFATYYLENHFNSPTKYGCWPHMIAFLSIMWYTSLTR